MSQNLARVGGNCAVLLGASYILVGITYLFLPAGQRVVGVGDPATYYTSFLQNPTPALFLYWETALGGLVGVGAVLAISDVVNGRGEGWVRWTSQLAVFGFAVQAIDSLRGVTLLPMRAHAYLAGDASTRAAIGATRLTLDYHGWFEYGAVGLWVLVVSLLALRARSFPKALAWGGVILTAAYWLVVAGFMTSTVPLLSVGTVVGGVVVAPVWYVWAGLRLRRGVGSAP